MQFTTISPTSEQAAPVLRVNDRNLNTLDLMVILSQQGLMPSLVQSLLIEEAIAPYQPTLEEQTLAYQQLRQHYQIQNEIDYSNWLSQRGLTSIQFYQLAIRTWQIEKFKRESWGLQLPSYFLKKKGQLDKVVYSLIRTQDQGLAQELYYRICEGENTFAELAVNYSEGEEVHTQGLIGPVEIGQIHPAIAQQLVTNPRGRVLLPIILGEWSIILRLEKFLPVQLNAAMEQRLLEELFEHWLAGRIQQTNLSIL